MAAAMQHLLQDLPDVALTAVCRRSRGGALLDTTTPVYDDYRAMIADPRVHAVVAVTPPSLCYDICLAAVHAKSRSSVKNHWRSADARLARW